MPTEATSSRKDRHPAISYNEILDKDSRPVPLYLREVNVPDIGLDPVAANRYYSRTFFQQEIDHVWNRTWQMACREEDVPNVGDCHIYEVVNKSLIVVRTAEKEIKAFHNVCLHRGRKLLTINGHRNEFRCPYHGMTWNCDGTFESNPYPWDFPQWEGRDMSLPEARVDRWGGFVFVNLDLSAPPLASILGAMIDDFERYEMADRHRYVWIQKKIRANWKATAEAFMEASHVLATHPQIMPSIADANSQYDLVNDWVSRQMSAVGVPSPFLASIADQEVYKRSGGIGSLPKGVSARRHLAETARERLSKATGKDYSLATDAEMLDSMVYNVFPNMSFWAGYPTNIVYRWRPNGMDPESCLMDVMMFRPCSSDEQLEPRAVQKLDLDDSWTLAEEQIGSAFAAVFDQDMGNLPFVQEGLRASANGEVHFSRYAELRIRHMHQMIDRLIAEGAARQKT
jgi:phenylpropionate dioxygenase-like ring-hydroxylating dioxygenase large terminal subunit